METVISAIVPTVPGAAWSVIVLVLGGLYIYRKIDADRKVTKGERDRDSQEMHDTLLKHEFKLSELSGIVNLHRDKLDSIDKQLAIVNTELVKLNVQVEHMADALKEQNEIMRASLNERKK